MAKSNAQWIRDFLKTQSAFRDVNIFFSMRPSSPIDCLTIYDAEGAVEPKGMRNDLVVFPGIQFIARASTGEEASRLIQLVWDWTTTVKGQSLGTGGPTLNNIQKTSTILSLGVEDKTLSHLLSFNVRLSLK